MNKFPIRRIGQDEYCTISYFQITNPNDIEERGIYTIVEINKERKHTAKTKVIVTSSPAGKRFFKGIDLDLPYWERSRHWNDKYFLADLGVIPYENGDWNHRYYLIREAGLEGEGGHIKGLRHKPWFGKVSKN